MGRIARLHGLLLAALLSAVGATAASSDATLVGKVTDKNGQPLPGVTLVLKNNSLAFQEQGTLSDAKGEYRFAHLPPGGGYQLTVSLSGYSTLIFSDLTLDSGRSLEQSVVLHPSGELKEVVRVQGKSDTLDTEKVTGSTTFSSTFISELPILGRDYQEILSLAPGVTDVDKTGNPNIHGARDTNVVTLVDGVSTTDPFTGYFGQNLNIESIQELEVITSAATAQYSRAQGGFANILTKSGSNEFLGTFKFYLRSDRLDRDGAGFEDPELNGGLQGDRLFTEQHFTDLMPFLSLSGAIVRDRVWYYVSFEYLHQETPINALSEAYVLPVYGNRAFGKVTWQMSPSQKLAFSFIFDKQRQENLGVNSLTAEESGYSKSRGGPTYTLKESAVFKPTVLLESTLSWFDNSFSQTPTTSPDSNGNGILFVDNHPELGGNGNGILEAVERDAGEDWDQDGFYDLYEDLDHDDHGGPGEDLDYDGYVSRGELCEGYHHEDRNCNGYLDAEDDTNLNGQLDPAEDIGISCYPDLGYCPGGKLPGTANNGKFDSEDKNGNGVLDVLNNSGYTAAPFWNDKNGNGYPDRGEYHAPLPPDRDLVRDSSGRTSGPSPIEYHDHRKRLSWVEDLSLFAADLVGTHDLRLGFAYEHEGYDNETFRAPVFNLPTGGFVTKDPQSIVQKQVLETIKVNLAIPAIAQNSATGDNLGIYFQDSWKPVPNLTLGLGLRYDYERLDSFGYTSFDPAAERHAFNSLLGYAALDGDPYDSITATGLCRDPIHSCLGSEDPALLVLKNQMLGLAYSQFTRHNVDVDIQSEFLKGITGGSTNLSGVPGSGLKVRSPEEIQITNSNLAPRLSLSWDPWADGKTMVFSSWGRYYDKLFLNAVTLEQNPDTVSRTYLSIDVPLDHEGFPNHNLWLPFAQSPLSAVQVDRSLATPYADEWTAGFRRELVPEVLVSLRYVHRDYHDQLQDIDINHHTAIEPATGMLADRLGDPTCYQSAPNRPCQNVPNGAPDLYVNNLFLNRVLRLGNFNEQTYRGWEVEFVRRLKRKWQLEASYTYSVAEGDAETYLSQIGNDPALVEFEPGYLSYDQRHVVKFNAVAFLPGDWRLGGTITWASGLPYSATVHYFDLDDVGYTQSRILYGQLGPQGYGITPENRNIHRNGSSYLINTRVVKSFVIGKSAASAFLEVYNLLNSDTLTVSAIDQIPATFIYPRNGPPIQIPPTSEVLGTRDFGRRFQIGFQVDF